MKKLNYAIKQIYETPALSREEYVKIRTKLPNKLKKLLDLAYDVDQSIENLKTLYRIMGKLPVYYLSTVYDRFFKMTSYYMVLISELIDDEDKVKIIKNETSKILKDMNKIVFRLRDVSYNILALVSSLKYYIYYFVYGPLNKIAKDIDSIIIERYADIIESRISGSILPSEIEKPS